MAAKTTESVSQVSTTSAETRIDIDSDYIRPVPAIDPFPQASSPSALGTHSVLATPSYVASLEFSIQRGFRIKLFTLLLLQLALTMGVATVARFALPIEVIFPAQSYGTLGLCFACLVGLPMLTYVRDRHPWNIILTAIWSIAWGVYMAAAHVDGGMVKSYVLFTIFGSLCVGVFFLLLFSCISYTDEYTGERKLISCVSAAVFAYFFMLTAAIVFTAIVPYFETPAHPIGALFVVTIIFFWVAYDCEKLFEKLQADDYMKGITYIYTDFIVVCCCCLCMGAVGSSMS